MNQNRDSILLSFSNFEGIINTNYNNIIKNSIQFENCVNLNLTKNSIYPKNSLTKIYNNLKEYPKKIINYKNFYLIFTNNILLIINKNNVYTIELDAINTVSYCIFLNKLHISINNSLYIFNEENLTLEKINTTLPIFNIFYYSGRLFSYTDNILYFSNPLDYYNFNSYNYIMFDTNIKYIKNLDNKKISIVLDNHYLYFLFLGSLDNSELIKITENCNSNVIFINESIKNFYNTKVNFIAIINKFLCEITNNFEVVILNNNFIFNSDFYQNILFFDGSNFRLFFMEDQ